MDASDQQPNCTVLEWTSSNSDGQKSRSMDKADLQLVWPASIWSGKYFTGQYSIGQSFPGQSIVGQLISKLLVSRQLLSQLVGSPSLDKRFPASQSLVDHHCWTCSCLSSIDRLFTVNICLSNRFSTSGEKVSFQFDVSIAGHGSLSCYGLVLQNCSWSYFFALVSFC